MTNNLRKLREIAGLTQEQLASSVGKSNLIISRYETNYQKLDIITAKELARVLRCSIDEIAGASEIRTNGSLSPEVMITKSETIRARIAPDLKHRAEDILDTLGLSVTAAITLFYRQVVLNEGLPFDVRIPNSKTMKAIKQTKARKGLIESDLKTLRKEFE